MNLDHLDIFTGAERIHRKFLDLIQLELDCLGIRDVNSVRALILMNLGDTEMTVSELMYRGCYMGSNVSYNLKKLTENGYVGQTRSLHDRRVIMVRNSPKGVELIDQLLGATLSASTYLMNDATKEAELAACRRTLRIVEQSCSRTIDRGSMGLPRQIAA